MSNQVEFQPRTTCELRLEACETCTPHWQKVLHLRDHETDLGEFDVIFCRRCKLGFTDPYPTEATTHLLYSTKQSSDFDVIHDSLVDRLKDLLSRRELVRLAPHDHVRAVLDFGTGNGRSAQSAAEVFSGAVVDAVDYQTAAPPLLQRPGCKVNYLEHAAFLERRREYDLIIVRHVLEHTHHPVQLVKSLADRLAPGGLIYLEVPNLDSGCARTFGRSWKGYYVPRHIFHYTTDSLREVVARAGLEAEIGRNEMPLMGNTVTILTGADKKSVLVQLLGIVLHPVQLVLEALHGSSTCINARCRRPGGAHCRAKVGQPASTA